MQTIRTDGFHFYAGHEKWLVRGVTYGPFALDAEGFRYPDAARVRGDMEQIAGAGANVIRLYDLPPESLAQAAAEHGIRLLIDLPWPKHLDVYEDRELRAKCLGMVADGVRRISGWGNVVGVLLGNEISPDLVRWGGSGAS